jgi:hypothetical protein
MARADTLAPSGTPSGDSEPAAAGGFGGAQSEVTTKEWTQKIGRADAGRWGSGGGGQWQAGNRQSAVANADELTAQARSVTVLLIYSGSQPAVASGRLPVTGVGSDKQKWWARQGLNL